MIADTWPDCSCRGSAPQMLEHSPKGCAVLPLLLLDAFTGDRPLTDEELAAIGEADERRRKRGYHGPPLDAQAAVSAGRSVSTPRSPW